LLFPADPCGFHFAAVPRSLASSSSSSHTLTVSSESVIVPNPSRAPRHSRQPSPSFFPLRDISKASLLVSEFSTARLCSALSVSHALDGLLLALPCRLISSRSHVLDSPLRGFSRCPASRLVDDCCPPVVSSVRLPHCCQSGANSRNPAFRALLQAAIRC
jgi:hypothetical protein